MYKTRYNTPRSHESKYHNKKVVYDNIVFDSTKEARRYGELKLLLRANKIKDLELQKTYVLIPTQKEPDTIGIRGGIIKGRVIEKAVKYIADFVYTDTETNETVVEDVKGIRTDVYKIKKKLMLYVYGIKIKEI